MGADSGRGAEACKPLSKEKVLRQALALADSEGIEALSIRRLGQGLNAGAMSLYHRVRNKEELLDGMGDLVFAKIELPESRDDWQAEMRARAGGVCQRGSGPSPWAKSRTIQGPANLRHPPSLSGDRLTTKSGQLQAAASCRRRPIHQPAIAAAAPGDQRERPYLARTPN